MKTFIILVVLVFNHIVFAQTNLPSLSVYGKEVSSFVPENWKFISKVEGDLNNDKYIDVAFVIENDMASSDNIDSIFIKKNRILAVYFKQRDGVYILHNQYNKFILSKENLEMSEPFQGININSEGNLEVNFQIWTNESKWFVSTHMYRFKLQNNNFDLVVYNANETNRETGDSVDYTIDFIQKKMQTYTYNYLKDYNPKVENKKIKIDVLKRLITLEEPFKWYFMGIKI